MRIPSNKTNLISYSEAINQATKQAMELSRDVMVMGQLIDYKSGVFGTTTGLVEKFGNKRVRDFPVAESLMTSAALGAAITGKRVLLVHIRIDFMLYSFDSIVNWGAGDRSINVIRYTASEIDSQYPNHLLYKHPAYAQAKKPNDDLLKNLCPPISNLNSFFFLF